MRGMPAARRAEEAHVADVRAFLDEHEGLEHLRARRRADLITLESGADDNPIAHARLRRIAVHLWTLECATHAGRWERTPFRGLLDEILDVLVSTFPWIVAPRE